jgi:undecaprenyl-phosphate 4-deoxy-4-formamido-L-arabinose transferase
VANELARIKALQIVVVDDGSGDNTFEVAERTLGELPGVSYVIVQLAKNFGQSAATAIGLSHAAGEVIVTLDDDLSFPPEQVFRLFDSLAESVDFVMGAPRRYHNSNSRRFFSEFARRLAIRAFDLPQDFVLSSFLVYQKGFVSRLDLSSIRVDEIGWMFQCTSRYLNLPVTTRRSIRKDTKYNIAKLVKTARPLMAPLLRLVGASSRWGSVVLALLAASLSVVNFFRALVVGDLQAGFPTISILLLINTSIGFILLSLQLSSTSAIHNLRKSNIFQMQRRIIAKD